jgi:hypothetical protein
MVLLKNYLLLICIILLYSCGNEKYKEKGSAEYIAEINEWRTNRIERLKKDNSWLNLVGLHWLKEGENTFGSGGENDFIFTGENIPARIGVFILKDSVVSIRVNEEADVLIDSSKIKAAVLKNDFEENTTLMELGSLRWFIIKRGDKFGVRVRDLNAKLLTEFKGIDTYPINEDWNVQADFVEYNPPKKIIVPDEIGNLNENFSPGSLVFKVDGNEYSIDPIESSRGYFLIIADLTSGEDTYGAGRYLYINYADSTGKVYIDFNKAYNPPCAFTKYATCLLPPKQNYLNLKITAGEKKFVKVY